MLVCIDQNTVRYACLICGGTGSRRKNAVDLSPNRRRKCRIQFDELLILDGELADKGPCGDGVRENVRGNR